MFKRTEDFKDDTKEYISYVYFPKLDDLFEDFIHKNKKIFDGKDETISIELETFISCCLFTQCRSHLIVDIGDVQFRAFLYLIVLKENQFLCIITNFSFATIDRFLIFNCLFYSSDVIWPPFLNHLFSSHLPLPYYHLSNRENVFGLCTFFLVWTFEKC